MEDSGKFEKLRQALKNAGFSKRSVAQTCQMVAAILHLGNLEFVMDKSRNGDAAVVKNLDTLNIVADFLGVPTSALQNALSFKMKMVEKEMCTIYFDPDAAADNRDELARTLYSLLFAWINENINQHLCRDDFSCFISLVDFPGMQNIPSSATRSNSLDQFCVNYANERLHYWIGNQLFESHITEYRDEGISNYVPEMPWYNNLACVEVIDKSGGLITIMDSQASRLPKKNEHTMVQAFAKKWNTHNSFKTGSTDRSGFPTFTIQHYTGAVTYSAEGLLERNSDTMNPDFISLLRGNTPDAPSRGMASMSEGAGSANPFVRSLFAGKAIATRVHPRFEETIVAAQQPVKPMRQPSTRRKGTIKRRATNAGEKKDDDDDDSGPNSVACVAGEFRGALDTLFQTLDDAQTWYVICINPNDGQLPNQLEGRGVKAQIRHLGLAAIARRAGIVFEVSMLPSEFCERYQDQLAMLGVSEGNESERIAQASTALDLGPSDIVEGNTKVDALRFIAFSFLIVF
jgi:chitin synthase